MSFLRRHLPPTLHNAIGSLIATVVLGVVSVAALFVPRVRTFVVPFASQQISIPAWLALFFALCGIALLVQLTRRLIAPSRDSRVQLFRSLSRDEQSIMRIVAHCEFGISEGELCERVPAPMQRFLYFIDHLVENLRLIERTEPVSGGAYWFLSERGRGVAVANQLFDE